MERQVSFPRVVHFTKLCVYLAWTWPPSRIASRWKTAKYDIAWSLSVLSALCLFIPLLNSIYVHQSNLVIVTQSAAFACSGCNFIIKTLIYRLHRKKMQILISEMEDFLKNAKSHELIVLQYYADRCLIFHGLISLMNYLSAVAIIAGPMFFHQPLPTFAVYPFAVDSGLPRYIAYMHQSFAGLQYSAGITTDCQVALIMWYAGARLEILARELKNVSNVREFQSFVEKHQRLLAYAVDVSDTMRYVALVTSAVSGIGSIMSGMQLVSNLPITVKIQYGPVILIAMMNLFVCAWPAENLLSTCDSMATAVYNISWTDMSTNFMKDILVILRRSQCPVKVSIGGFVPTLSLRFYGSFLSAAYSYFTTLRVAMMASNEN